MATVNEPEKAARARSAASNRRHIIMWPHVIGAEVGHIAMWPAGLLDLAVDEIKEQQRGRSPIDDPCREAIERGLMVVS